MRRIQNRDLAARQDLGENEKSWQMDGHIPKYGIKSICLAHLFNVPFSETLHHRKGGERAPAKNGTKTKKKIANYNANNTSKRLPPLQLMPCNALFMYLKHFFKLPFSDPSRHLSNGKIAPANDQQNKNKKQKATMQTTRQNMYHLLNSCLAMPSSCIWNIFSRCPFLTPFIF